MIRDPQGVSLQQIAGVVVLILGFGYAIFAGYWWDGSTRHLVGSAGMVVGLALMTFSPVTDHPPGAKRDASARIAGGIFSTSAAANAERGVESLGRDRARAGRSLS